MVIPSKPVFFGLTAAVLPPMTVHGASPVERAWNPFFQRGIASGRLVARHVVKCVATLLPRQYHTRALEHQVMRPIGNGSTMQLGRNDTEIVSRIMPEQGQLERLGSIRNCQRSAISRGVLMIAD